MGSAVRLSLWVGVFVSWAYDAVGLGILVGLMVRLVGEGVACGFFLLFVWKHCS